MRLKNAVYRLLLHERECFEHTQQSLPHGLDGWIELTFSDGAIRSITCVQLGDEFVMKVRDGALSGAEDLTGLDVSMHGIWPQLIGEAISISVDDRDLSQWISVSSGEHSLWFCAYEDGHWGADQIYITDKFPIS